MTATPALRRSFVALAALLISSQASAGESNYHEYRTEDRDMKLVGRVYHVSEGVVAVEAWPTPRRLRPKVDRLELVSPSGKRYKVSDVQNFPMSQLGKKRAGYSRDKKTLAALVSEWFVDTAWAECPPGCTDPNHGHGGSSDDDDRSAEAFAGFGILAGVAATQEKEWVSGGTARVEEEPGQWKLLVDVLDDKSRKHSFTVPFELAAIPTEMQLKIPPPPPANEREIAFIEWTDEEGRTTRTKLNPDGSRTVTVTDAKGNVISQETRPPAKGAKRTWLDPDTGLRISEWVNPDGSVTRRAEDGKGNWSEGVRYPGGKKQGASTTAKKDDSSTATKETPATVTEEETPGGSTTDTPPAVPQEDEGLPLPPQYRPKPEDPGLPLPPIITRPRTQEKPKTPPQIPPDEPPTQGDDKPPTIYGEETPPPPVGVALRLNDAKWIPRFGNTVTVTAQLYDKVPGQNVWKRSTQFRRITVRFEERSNEPGQCVNYKLPWDDQDTPDLFLDQGKNPETDCEEEPGSMGYHHRQSTTKTNVNRHTFTVSSQDFGGFGKMAASCNDCVQLMAYGTDGAVEPTDPEDILVTVPRDYNGNQIADAWLWDKLKSPLADDDTDDVPKGNDVQGDGYSAYEEYRGFFAKGLHLRTSLDTKTLFIRNRHNLDTSKFAASQLEYYDILHPEWNTDRVVNYNYHHAHLVDQHGLLLVKENLDKGLIAWLAGAPIGFTDTSLFRMGPPRNVERVSVDSAAIVRIYGGGALGLTEIAVTVAHELGHSVGMAHHGNPILGLSDKTIDPWPGKWYQPFHITAPAKYGATLCGGPLPRKLSVGSKGNQASGDMPCLMRYPYWGEVFVQENGDLDCLMREPGQTTFCASPNGTMLNAGNRTAGNASNGDCMGQLQVNDA